MRSRRVRLGLGAALVVAVVASVVVVARRAPSGALDGSTLVTDEHATRVSTSIAADVQSTWAELLRRGGRSYSEARLVPFRDAVRSECGWDERAGGPFYCDADERLYLDLDLATRLLQRGEPTGTQALAYVIAHGMGHHVQALTGVDRRVRRDQRVDPPREAELALELELQADCFAGVWARGSTAGLLGEASVAAALTAVADEIRASSPSHTNAPPETWLHGDLERRIAWVRRGLASGDLDACDPATAALAP